MLLVTRYMFVTSLLLGVYARVKTKTHARRKIHEIGQKRNFEKKKDWDHGIMAFREMVVQEYLEGDVSSTKKPNGSAVEWILTILQGKTPDSRSMWDDLQSKKDRLLTEKVDDPNMKNLEQAFKRVMRIMEKAKVTAFRESDQDVVRAAWQNFFPQAYSSVVYSVRWLNALSKYLTMLAAGYIDLMKAGDYDECKLAEQLNMFKPRILELAKMFAKLRYEALEKTSWRGGRDEFKYSASLTISDGVTGRIYKDIPLTQIQGRILTPLKEQIADFIMKHLVFQYHALYNETWGSNSCSLENPMIMTELEVDYPDACMDYDGICSLPCGFYSESFTWCVTKLKSNRWMSASKEKYYDECRLPDWNKCTLITKLKTSEIKEKVVEDENTTMTDKTNLANSDADYPVTVSLVNSKNPSPDNTSSSILHGVSAITSLLANKMGEKMSLDEDEKKLVNIEIAKKVENYITDKNGTSGETRTLKQSDGFFVDHGLSNIVEVLVVKAFLEKKRHGNILSYLDGLEKWKIKSNFIKHFGDNDSLLYRGHIGVLEKRAKLIRTSK